MLPLVTFPICNAYLPARFNPLAPKEPIHPATGMPANDVTRAVPDDAAPINPNKQLAPKKTFESGFGEHKKLTPAQLVVQRLSVQIATFPIMGTVLEILERDQLIVSVIEIARASTADGAKFKSTMFKKYKIKFIKYKKFYRSNRPVVKCL